MAFRRRSGSRRRGGFKKRRRSFKRKSRRIAPLKIGYRM